MDNKDRLSVYKKKASDEDLLLAMNELLAEPGVTYHGLDADQSPTIFIFGLPRSGTTLVYQLLCYALDIGYINNLMARFWLAPAYGIALSKAVIGDIRDDSFESDYGKSVKVEGPHEFSYFWQHWLKMFTIQDLISFGKPREAIQWHAVARHVQSIKALLGKGIIFKTNYTANFITDFARHFSMPLFIYIDRDDIDVAVSILKARKAYYGNKDSWWATYPPTYQEICNLPYDEQIARQVKDLKNTYEKELLKVPNYILRISYKDLCADPPAFIESVTKHIKNRYGYSLKVFNPPPEIFQYRTVSRKFSIEEKAIIRKMA